MDVLFIPSLTQSLETYLIDDEEKIIFKIVENKSMLPMNITAIFIDRWVESSLELDEFEKSPQFLCHGAPVFF